MYEYKIYNVKLFYLPAHSSHVLQPLDLSIFSLIKHHYRKEIDKIAAYDDTGPVKKIQFIEFYDEARNFALTVLNIKAGWRGAGLVPYNPDKVLTSKQVLLGQQAPQTPPKSHKRALSEEPIYFETPCNQKSSEKPLNSFNR
jgi:DDE superfamily endonuclease